MRLSYSSLTAFLAHLAALKGAPMLDGEERARLEEMERLVRELPDSERAVLDSAPGAGHPRHAQRAQLRLERLLASRGILSS